MLLTTKIRRLARTVGSVGILAWNLGCGKRKIGSSEPASSLKWRGRNIPLNFSDSPHQQFQAKKLRPPPFTRLGHGIRFLGESKSSIGYLREFMIWLVVNLTPFKLRLRLLRGFSLLRRKERHNMPSIGSGPSASFGSFQDVKYRLEYIYA
jgi:hypothetical protein